MGLRAALADDRALAAAAARLAAPGAPPAIAALRAAPPARLDRALAGAERAAVPDPRLPPRDAARAFLRLADVLSPAGSARASAPSAARRAWAAARVAVVLGGGTAEEAAVLRRLVLPALAQRCVEAGLAVSLEWDECEAAAADARQMAPNHPADPPEGSAPAGGAADRPASEPSADDAAYDATGALGFLGAVLGEGPSAGPGWWIAVQRTAGGGVGAGEAAEWAERLCRTAEARGGGAHCVLLVAAPSPEARGGVAAGGGAAGSGGPAAETFLELFPPPTPAPSLARAASLDALPAPLRATSRPGPVARSASVASLPVTNGAQRSTPASLLRKPSWEAPAPAAPAAAPPAAPGPRWTDALAPGAPGEGAAAARVPYDPAPTGTAEEHRLARVQVAHAPPPRAAAPRAAAPRAAAPSGPLKGSRDAFARARLREGVERRLLRKRFCACWFAQRTPPGRFSYLYIRTLLSLYKDGPCAANAL